MRQPRVYTGQQLDPGREIELEPATARHLGRVLRLEPGDLLRVFNGNGAEYLACMKLVSKNAARAEILDLAASEQAAKLHLKLLIGISRGERMEFAIQKAVELGVNSIHPLQCTRSVVQLRGERLERRLAHWRAVVISACEQSGRCHLPVITAPAALPPTLNDCKADCRLVLHHQGSNSLDRIAQPSASVDLLIGPEGGLAPAELALAQNLGFSPLRLGPRVMRTETAPLAALSAIQMLWGDFRSD